ncbi:hypothetical protein PRIPAC_71239 [Pristionchus pacificus]|uniref:Uncharacterized protein n=1 Tax=Pristionchus pacificus TaxID=54126 RepID=A0A2A6CZT2_PRIPA|nr:hypothetical protein PRIPAC_71239 [Pristionchus pacificus]|eukprot:PDM83620.1 hypothetical protein PRIPAC_30107 [Pristionchus pacificus]
MSIFTSKLHETIARIRIDLDVADDFFNRDRPSLYKVFSKNIRMILSGMVLFRTVLLLLFLKLIRDESDKCGDSEENRNMFPVNHLWWNKKKFIEMGNDVDIGFEYSLHD